MANKKFIVQYTGTGQGVSRSVVELPIDEKLEGRALDTKIRALAEMKIKKSNRRDRGTIRIVSVKPYNDSVEDSMDDKITSIAAKYGHEMQNDAFGQPASEVIGIANLKAQAQKAVDALWAASKKAGAAIAAYNKALGKSAKGGMAGFAEASKKMVDYHDVLNNLKSGANTRI